MYINRDGSFWRSKLACNQNYHDLVFAVTRALELRDHFNSRLSNHCFIIRQDLEG
jgi:hypothetical protein